MGQSFLTHDEKSSGSPSPDLLQFNGVSSHPHKFFGSLSSVKETSTISSSSRSPDSEQNLLASSCTPPVTHSYSSLVPTPIQPGNVSRLRDKFMDFDRTKRKGSFGAEREGHLGILSNSECRLIRPATTSPGGEGRARDRARDTSSHRTSRRSSTTRQQHYEKLDVIRSDNDLRECFRQMGNSANFTSVTPLVRHRPRTRPYVPQPRSVIIRAGYLPVVQTVDLIHDRSDWTSESSVFRGEDSEPSACYATEDNPEESVVKRENLLMLSSAPALSSSSPRGKSSLQIVTKERAHTDKVLTKDAEVNTSAEILVLPPGTKTSVVLKSGMEVVDGKARLRKRKRKRGLLRIPRFFGRFMIRLVELF